MKKSELKRILKPLIQECVKEAILEDGILSNIIGEVAKGMMSAPAPISQNESPPPDPSLQRIQRNAFTTEQSSRLKDHKKKLMSAIGTGAFNGVDLFEGTTPAPAQASPQQSSSPLSGQSPSDAGVDISSIMGVVGNSWSAHMNEIKERK